MKPIIILPPDVMAEDDIQLLRDNGLCVVVSTDPAKVRFVDPIPAVSSRTEMENAAIALSRKVLSPGWLAGDKPYTVTRGTIASMYLDLLTKGTTLDAEKMEYEKNVFDNAKIDEIRKIAREEARAEREAAKAAKQKPTDKKS